MYSSMKIYFHRMNAVYSETFRQMYLTQVKYLMYTSTYIRFTSIIHFSMQVLLHRYESIINILY